MKPPSSLLDGYRCHLSAHPRAIGRGKRASNHHHPFYELGIVTQGHCLWMLDGDATREPSSIIVRANEAILIPPNQWHYEEALDEPVSIEWTGLSGPPEAFRDIALSQPLALESWSTEIYTATRQIHLELLSQPESYERRLSLLLADLLLLLRRASTAAPAPRPRHSATDHLNAARRFLEENPNTDLGMGQVARYHGYSQSHFEVIFAQRYGMTPKRYHQQQRLRAVLDSLRLGLRSPKELASLHGFSDSAYFCRWFRRETGTTPSLFEFSPEK